MRFVLWLTVMIKGSHDNEAPKTPIKPAIVKIAPVKIRITAPEIAFETT